MKRFRRGAATVAFDLLLATATMTAADPHCSDLLIVKTAAVAAPRDAAWRAWSERDALVRWFGRDATIELRPGGAYEIYFLRDEPPGRRGGEGNTVQSYAPGRLLAFTWNAPPQFGALREQRTQVVLEFADRAGGGTDVKLTHYGFGPGEEWAKVHAYFDAAWTRVLQGFTAHLGAAAPAALPPHDRGMDYVEFVAPDLEAAKTFYAAAFGWGFTDYGPDYTSFVDGRLAGGFRRGTPAAPGTNPLIVLFARDLEATEAAVRAAGGAITTPTHTFPGGRRFHFTDPNGLELAVWTDRTRDGAKIE